MSAFELGLILLVLIALALLLLKVPLEKSGLSVFGHPKE